MLARRRGAGLLVPPIAIAIMVSVTALIGYGAPRFRTPADVALLVLAAVAVDAAGNSSPQSTVTRFRVDVPAMNVAIVSPTTGA